ncbi:MAG: DUF6157 family protein [Bacteroidia bacterium]
MHTTNYINTFIGIAEDCKATAAEIPPLKGAEKTAANLQFELLRDHPYEFTSDDILFQVYATKNKIAAKDIKAARETFFSKGQACMRASPLTKRYGWGIHNNEEGKIALVAVDSKEYKKLSSDKNLKQTKGMRSSRA